MENNITINAPSIPNGDINQGTVAIETSRAVAEAQGKLVIAKRFPRDVVQAYAKVSQVCQRRGIAERAFYNYKRGNSTVSGVTIRFAEELARCWGNIDYGIKELSQDKGKSEMQAYAWDMETNTISQQNFTSRHIREANGTAYDLKSQRDIYEANANMGARRLRSRILAILPSDLVDMAIEECKKTLAGNNSVPLIDRINNLIIQFEKIGVTQEELEKRIQKKAETFTVDDFVEYVGIYNSIKNKESKISEWFEGIKPNNNTTADDLTNILKGNEK